MKKTKVKENKPQELPKQITMIYPVSIMLGEIANVRKKEGSLVCTRQGIVADLINRAHKREVKS